MNIYLTLDYEIFFGAKSGSPQKSLIEPFNKLLVILDKYNIKTIIFVDIAYLLKLKEYSQTNIVLKTDYEAIKNHLIYLSSNGHDIQLHIHPHWEDSEYINGKWEIITKRYKLSDFSETEADLLITKYKLALEQITGKNVFAYRAGGWCIQPFNHISDSLKKNNIWLDSTIFYKGKSKSNTHSFDFTNAPNKSFWRFSTDPLIIDNTGFFSEIPISSYSVNPIFYWRFFVVKLLKIPKHIYLGDGQGLAINSNLFSKISLFLKKSKTPVSIDGYRVKYLYSAYKTLYKSNENFVIIGHPKLFTVYSLKKLDHFLVKTQYKNIYKTFSDEI